MGNGGERGGGDPGLGVLSDPVGVGEETVLIWPWRGMYLASSPLVCMAIHKLLTTCVRVQAWC
jgi:hypothetical protein